ARGNMNTDKKTNTYHAKYRELLEKLNIIGLNNIKAMYVGVNGKDKGKKPPKTIGRLVKQFQQNQDIKKPKPPKLIGRLATTIIMEDGLWIG
ncbi:hypothetical protein CQA53_11810, partial [Helicobacter didelphidarum]